MFHCVDGIICEERIATLWWSTNTHHLNESNKTSINLLVTTREGFIKKILEFKITLHYKKKTKDYELVN